MVLFAKTWLVLGMCVSVVMFLELVVVEDAEGTQRLCGLPVFAPHSLGPPIPEVDLLGFVQVVWDIMFVFRTVI